MIEDHYTVLYSIEFMLCELRKKVVNTKADLLSSYLTNKKTKKQIMAQLHILQTQN